MNSPTVVLSSLVAAGLLLLGGSGAAASATVPSGPVQVAQGGNQNYTLKSLKGAHGFTYSGSHKTLGPVASSGRIDFDGQGNAHAEYSTSVNGTTFTGTFEATYLVNGNGTGSIVVNLPWLSTQAHGRFVIVDDGKGTYFMSVDPGYSVTGSTSRL